MVILRNIPKLPLFVQKRSIQGPKQKQYQQKPNQPFLLKKCTTKDIYYKFVLKFY